MSIRALVVGVSDYSATGNSDLQFCVNDIESVNKSLIDGLLAEKNNIISLGNNGIVKTSMFIDKLRYMSSVIKKEDTFIFYFSGHGGNSGSDHHVLFSDGSLKTQEIIELLDTFPCKNKLIILDSCMSGNFKIEKTAIYNPDATIADFFGKGYAVLSSSNAIQYSYGHPNKPLSLFTSFLCEALTDKLLIRKGNKSLYDIQKLLFLYLEIWNKNNPDKKQNPLFRANLGGTIMFPVEVYTPYKTKKYNVETDHYIIHSVKPLNSSIAKRFAVNVILKTPLSFKELSNINNEIVKRVRGLEIHNNEKAEDKWKNKLANIIFCYYGRDESDMINSNYICRTTWVDETQDKNHWYKVNKNCEIINDVHFNYHSYYNTLKIFQQENTAESDSLIAQTQKIISQLISLAEEVISNFNELINETKTEEEFIQEMDRLTLLIDKYYFAETELNLPPKEIKNWCTSCTGLASTIHDFTLYYNKIGLLTRTTDNRILCMKITKDRYYEDLEKLRVEESKISTLIDRISSLR